MAHQYPGIVEQNQEEQQPDRLVTAGDPVPHLLVAPVGRLYPPLLSVDLDEPVWIGCDRSKGDAGGKHVVSRLALALGGAGNHLPGIVLVDGRFYYQSKFGGYLAGAG